MDILKINYESHQLIFMKAVFLSKIIYIIYFKNILSRSQSGSTSDKESALPILA